MMTYIFCGLLVAMIIQRLLEVRLSTKNEQDILANGGMEYGRGHFFAMKVLHSAWFISMAVELYFKAPGQTVSPWLVGLGFAGMILGQTFRYIAIKTLGKRWTVKIFVLPEAPAVNHGIYRYIKHPNYLGVILELAFFPLMQGLFFSSIVFTVLNGILLKTRISAEEEILAKVNNYDERLSGRSRFIPVPTKK